jgi:hypothetical protein
VKAPLALALLALAGLAAAQSQTPSQPQPQAQAPAPAAERPAGGLNLNLNKDDLRRPPSQAAQDRANDRKKGVDASGLPEMGGNVRPSMTIRSGSSNPFPKDMNPGQP